MFKIGIIGKGFVGTAVAHGFSSSVGYEADIKIYDKDKTRSLNTLEEVLQTDFVFVSVPTPSNKDGSINLKSLDTWLIELNDCIERNNFKSPIILIRSTVIPGTTEIIQNNFKKLKIVFNPEFLTERSANFDFISQTRFVLGGKPEYTERVAELYRHRFGQSISIIMTDYQTAEMIKYVCNNFFATKVSFLNEMKLISDAVNAKWDDVVEGFLRDGRVGSSHTQVPGPDGKYGFGGSCFPKDIQAMINFSESLNISPNVLKGVWQTNLTVRPEKDWEKLKGRSIVDNE